MARSRRLILTDCFTRTKRMANGYPLEAQQDCMAPVATADPLTNWIAIEKVSIEP